MKCLKFNSNYKVTYDGKIFSSYSNKFLSTFKEKSGYIRVGLWCPVAKKKIKFLVHRLVAEAYIDNPFNLEVVNHLDGDKTNNKVENLEWTTSGLNQEHAYSTGLKQLPKGILNGRVVLSEEDVLEIYSALLDGVQNKVLAESYNISKSVICSIKAKTLWNSLLKDLPDCDIVRRSKPLDSYLVKEVCKLLHEKHSCEYILEKLQIKGVNKDHINDIKRHKSFKNISKNYTW